MTSTGEQFTRIEATSLLIDVDDELTFRRWAISHRYGDSAYAFRKLLRKAGLLPVQSASGTHWRRGAKDYGWRGSEAPIIVEVWWPMTDPCPAGELWPD